MLLRSQLPEPSLTSGPVRPRARSSGRTQLDGPVTGGVLWGRRRTVRPVPCKRCRPGRAAAAPGGL